MDWQTPEDTVPSSLVTDAQIRSLIGRPPASGAWREGDPVADRLFASVGAIDLEAGGRIPSVRVAYETFGERDPDGGNAVLVLHALTGDSHLRGPAGPGQPTGGWWAGIVGPGLAIDTDRWFVVAPNMLGGCQGTTGPASLAPDGAEWGDRFPYITIRDQVAVQAALADALGIDVWAAVVGGSMGGMQALEWGAGFPDRMRRLAILAAPAIASADQIALNSVQAEAIRMDPAYRDGDYFDAADGDGPHRGLALARRMALLNYRSPDELNQRFARSWQSGISPMGDEGRYAVESYLDFHGNKFTRRFDATSYIRLIDAMSSHDVGRDRGGVETALGRVRAATLVVGIDSDRLFPVPDQRLIARAVPGSIDGGEVVVISSDYGHDGFLIENEAVGRELARLLDADADADA
ncbi:homoserine O-acetyltransferase MetX [Clavibacter phaseoli]|uniref:homoserine O-acetyltransferase MetX n=1 Tax=Clavibacter phaseoli TaxID=1734031 RepID=UPI000E6695AE|nr:homoserine O-acetyltransferase [Clavibacter phaseoli]RIJ57456.1 homoserine O-acetyltransferase [Clavibacter phaseoli]UKF30848.1 homoserine O-acetyltransferase [Clavibacter phaseoli]UKF36766.1 homoserine O-acetyltransferase [Clavibacter phaseoli]